MTNDHLKNTLKELHAKLASNGQVDPELKGLLQSLDSDIHELLDKTPTNSSAASGLVAQTQALSARFAARHPQIEPALRELAELLERIGI